MSDERCHHVALFQLGQFFCSRSLGLIALSAYNAKEPKPFPARGSKLMPRKRRDLHQVVNCDVRDLIAHENFARTMNDHHDMRVQMPLQRRVPAFSDFEVPKLYRKVVSALEESLPRNGLEVRSSILLVRMDIDAFPPIAAAVAQNHESKDTRTRSCKLLRSFGS